MKIAHSIKIFKSLYKTVIMTCKLCYPFWDIPNPYTPKLESKAYNASDLYVIREQSSLWEVLRQRQRKIACISLVLCPVTCPIWTINYICCVSLMKCCDEQFNSNRGLVCLSRATYDDTRYDCCSNYAALFCSVLYPLHACPDFHPCDDDEPWGKIEDYALLEVEGPRIQRFFEDPIEKRNYVKACERDAQERFDREHRRQEARDKYDAEHPERLLREQNELLQQLIEQGKQPREVYC